MFRMGGKILKCLILLVLWHCAGKKVADKPRKLSDSSPVIKDGASALQKGTCKEGYLEVAPEKCLPNHNYYFLWNAIEESSSVGSVVAKSENALFSLNIDNVKKGDQILLFGNVGLNSTQEKDTFVKVSLRKSNGSALGSMSQSLIPKILPQNLFHLEALDSITDETIKSRTYEISASAESAGTSGSVNMVQESNALQALIFREMSLSQARSDASQGGFFLTQYVKATQVSEPKLKIDTTKPVHYLSKSIALKAGDIVVVSATIGVNPEISKEGCKGNFSVGIYNQDQVIQSLAVNIVNASQSIAGFSSGILRTDKDLEATISLGVKGAVQDCTAEVQDSMNQLQILVFRSIVWLKDFLSQAYFLYNLDQKTFSEIPTEASESSSPKIVGKIDIDQKKDDVIVLYSRYSVISGSGPNQSSILGQMRRKKPDIYSAAGNQILRGNSGAVTLNMSDVFLSPNDDQDSIQSLIKSQASVTVPLIIPQVWMTLQQYRSINITP